MVAPLLIYWYGLLTRPTSETMPELCGEIAAIMDCPINTVKTRMFHARNKLRALVPILAAPRGAAQAYFLVT